MTEVGLNHRIHGHLRDALIRLTTEAMKNHAITAAQGKTAHPVMAAQGKSVHPAIMAAQGKISMPVMAGQGASVFA